MVGPLARSATDLDLVMNIVVRPPIFQRHAMRIRLPAPRKKTLREYRIGLWLEDTVYPPDKEVGDCLEKLVSSLSKKGAQIEEKKPDINLKRIYSEVFGELSYLTNARLIPRDQFDSLLQKSKELDEKDQSRDANYARIVTKTYRDWQILNEKRAIARQKWADFFKEYDILLSPAVRIAAFPHDHTDLSQRMIKFNDQKEHHFSIFRI